MGMTRRECVEGAAALVATWALWPRTLAAQGPAGAPPPAEGKFQELRGGVGIFTQSGGTIGYWLGSATAVVIDSQMAESAAVCLSGLRRRGGEQLEWLINTHHHFDHTGGNGVFRPVVRSIVAHAHVPELQRRAARERNLVEPVVADTTFTETLRRDLSGETLALQYWGPAHTRGDLTVHFEAAGVVHLGDLVFNRLYPVIDRPGGASIANWILVLEKLAASYGKEALYIFGHARPDYPVTGSVSDVLYQRDYLSSLLETARTELAKGKPVEEICQLESLPGFPDHFARGTRLTLAENLRIACEELQTP